MKRAVACLVVLVAAASSGPSAQAPTFSTKLVSVRVDVLVNDGRGWPIRGLQPGDFELYDNGVRQTIDLVSFEKLPVNVVLTLDMSASMAGERLIRLRDAARAVLAALNRDDQAALVTFSHSVARHASLTSDLALVGDALESVDPGGETALFDASYATLLTGQSDAGRTVAILFTDGIDTSSWLTPESVLQAARRSNVVLYAATIGAASRVAFLRDLARVTGGSARALESDRDVREAFIGILDEFRERYLLGFTPRDVLRDGWHTLDVRVKNRRAVVRAREGYIAGP